METDAILFSGKFATPAGRQAYNKSWERLSAELNALDGPTKNREKWSKVWTDLKNKIKKKGAMVRQHARGTGGGPATMPLTPFEERVLNLIGETAVVGLDVEEVGAAVAVPEPPEDPREGTSTAFDEPSDAEGRSSSAGSSYVSPRAGRRGVKRTDLDQLKDEFLGVQNRLIDAVVNISNSINRTVEVQEEMASIQREALETQQNIAAIQQQTLEAVLRLVDILE